jgi:chondroitin 4-sulfotransferase 11
MVTMLAWHARALKSETLIRRVYLLRQRLMGSYVFIHINKCGGTSVEAALGIPVKVHDTALQRRRRIGSRRWNRAFTFSVVRHPYSRVISQHAYRVRTNQTRLATTGLGLNDWIRRTYRDRERPYYDEPRMFAPCKHWLTDEFGEFIVDFVARLESIEADWRVIQEQIGSNAALPHHNATPSVGWEALDSESRRIIDACFREDFEAFGYTTG